MYEGDGRNDAREYLEDGRLEWEETEAAVKARSRMAGEPRSEETAPHGPTRQRNSGGR